MENYFCVLAKTANRYEVKNGNEPSPGKPKEEIISDLEEFVTYAKTVMGVLGYKLFEPKVPVAFAGSSFLTNEVEFYCRRNNLEAKGKRTSDGFVVLAGSHVSLSVGNYVSKGHKELRERNSDIIDENGILREDIACDSPSAASVFVIGKNSNGLIEWKTADGKTLKEFKQWNNYTIQ